MYSSVCGGLYRIWLCVMQHCAYNRVGCIHCNMDTILYLYPVRQTVEQGAQTAVCKSQPVQKVDSAVEIYTDKIRRDLENTRAIVSGMVSAYNNKEFHAYLQPKVSLHTGKVVGAEALVRWIKADGTMVMPGKFIDIFERNGFITKVDFAILDQYLRSGGSRYYKCSSSLLP